jgi:hypothetical protein
MLENEKANASSLATLRRKSLLPDRCGLMLSIY